MYIPTAEDYELLANNTTITYETDINSNIWFRLTGKGDYTAQSILIPATKYIDNAPNTPLWDKTEVYLQSATSGTDKNTVYALRLYINNGMVRKTMTGVANCGTGLMLRPVRYMRVGTAP